MKDLKFISLIAVIVVAVLVLLSTLAIVAAPGAFPIESTIETTVEPTQSVEELIALNLESHLRYVEYHKGTSKEDVLEKLDDIQMYLIVLETIMLEDENADYYDIYEDIIGTEIVFVNTVIEMYKADIAEFEQAELDALWEARMERYSTATKIWLFLKEEMQLNDAVCAGIIGNMMAESGGHTLNIDWANWDNRTGYTYYGICQWNARPGSTYYKYSPNNQVGDISLEDQLILLKNSLPAEFNVKAYGNKYQQGFNYEQFCAMTDPGEAAVAFAKVYERCNSKYVERRIGFAETAYKYFVEQDQA